MSEIEFLLLFAEKGDIVIYSGAAPGTHINYLSSLFEGVYFKLIDPAPFNIKVIFIEIFSIDDKIREKNLLKLNKNFLLMN